MTDETTPTTCAQHPGVQTSLRCATCGTPICPNCLVVTPVGMKCRKCAAGANSALYRPSAMQILLAILVSAVAGAVAGWAVQFSLGFLTIFLAIAYGAFAGQVILRASGRKRGLAVAIPAAVGLLTGAVGGRLLVAALLLSSQASQSPPYGVWHVLVDLVIPSPIPLVALIAVIASAVVRIIDVW